MDLQLTILFDLDHVSRSVRRLLSASNDRDAHILWKGALVNIYCSKVIYCGNTIGNCPFGDAVLQINLTPSRGPQPILDAKSRQGIVEHLQAKLLAYRQKNIEKVRASRFDLPQFNSTMRILARVLGACLVDAPELQAGLEPVLRRYEEHTQEERWLDARCVAIESMLFHCHTDKESEKLYVGKITTTASSILQGRGLISPFEPKAMGAILRSLGIFPKRDSQGYSVRLTDSTRRFIHRLARDFDVAAVQLGAARCPHCYEIFPARKDGNEGGKQFHDDKAETASRHKYEGNVRMHVVHLNHKPGHSGASPDRTRMKKTRALHAEGNLGLGEKLKNDWPRRKT